MKPKLKERTPDKTEEEVRCDRCGGFNAIAFGDKHICAACYNEIDSCCPEFGADDLWQKEDNDGE